MRDNETHIIEILSSLFAHCDSRNVRAPPLKVRIILSPHLRYWVTRCAQVLGFYASILLSRHRQQLRRCMARKWEEGGFRLVDRVPKTISLVWSERGHL